MHSEYGVCRLPIFFEARSRIAPGIGVHCVTGSGRQHLGHGVSVERDESTKSSNATYGTLMMHRPISTEALKAAEDVAATRSSTTRPVTDVAPRMR